MAINDGDLFAVKFCQKVLGKDVCMVWTITTENPSGVVDIKDVAEWIRDTIGPLLFTAQSNSVVGGTLVVENLTDGLTFAEVPLVGQGSLEGDISPAFVAAGIKLTRTNKLTRSGSKRIPGMVEAVITNGQFTPGFITGNLEPLAAALAEPHYAVLGTGENVQIQPVIIGRKQDPPGSGRYTWDLNRVQAVSGWTVNPNVTSQVSRK